MIHLQQLLAIIILMLTVELGVAYVIVGQTVGFPAQSPCHLGEALGFNEVVEGEGWEHGAVAVDVGFDEQGSASYAIEVDDVPLVAVDICGLISTARSGFPFFDKVTYHPSRP